VERPGMQQWNKGSRTKTAAAQRNGNNGSSHKTTATSWRREDNQHDLQKGHQAGDRKASTVVRVCERERERERVKKKIWDDYENQADWKLIRKPLGTRWS
jgi:hypothetical protein